MRIQITAAGVTYPISRDVSTDHPPQVHEALGTASESELQASLDAVNVDDWYDAQGRHRGPDAYGLEIFR